MKLIFIVSNRIKLGELKERNSCVWKFKYVHYDGNDQPTGLEEECKITIKKDTLVITRKNNRNAQAKWIFAKTD